MLVQCWTGNKARVILLLDMLFLRHHLKAINVPNSSAERELHGTGFFLFVLRF